MSYISLRDYMAARAMQGDWSSQGDNMGSFDIDAELDQLAKRAELYYRMADAMLLVREKA